MTHKRKHEMDHEESHKRRKIDDMTKEDIITEIKKAKCKKLKGLALYSLTKQQLIDHLAQSCCPVLKELVE